MRRVLRKGRQAPALIPKLVLLLAVLVLSACSAESTTEINWLDASWEEITEAAKNTEVSFHMWGGSAAINKWIDDTVAPLLKEGYDLSLNRVASDAPVFVNRLITEKEANRAQGSIDLMWINGENFKRAFEAGVLAGPFLDKLPNFQSYLDPASAELDFGFPTNGFEAPWGRAQFVFEYDSAKVTPPRSFQDLRDWVGAHPGSFTYPEAQDFTGSAFIRQAFIALNGGAEQFLDGFDPELYAEKSAVLWNYLNSLKPYLWQEGRTYPQDLPFLDGLFERGEVLLNMTYTQAQAQARILEGRYPATVRGHVFEDASIFNTHFTAIAFNAPNIPGALVLANELLSPALQLSKNSPTNWGDFTVLDLARLGAEDRRAFDSLDLGSATPSLAVLEAAAVPELPAAYLEALERDWYTQVLGQ